MDEKHDTLLTVRLAAEGGGLSADALPMSLLGALGNGIEAFVLGGAKFDADAVVFRIEPGSIRLRFLATTTAATTLFSSGLGAALDALGSGLLPEDPKRAHAIAAVRRFLQEDKTHARSIEFGIPERFRMEGMVKAEKVTLSKDSDLRQGSLAPRVFEEMTLRGKIERMGDEDNPGFDVRVPGVPRLIHVHATKDQLTGNPNLFLQIVARVRYRLDPATGTRSEFTLLHFVDKPADPKAVLREIVEAGTKAWAGVPDPDAWLSDLRGA